MPMTRLLRFVVPMIMIAGMVPSTAEAATTTRRYQIEELDADFVLATKTEGVYRWIGVHAERRTNQDTGRVSTRGYPTRGTCEGDDTGFNLSCSGRGLPGWRVTRFEADPGMNLAVLVMKRKRRVIRMRFTGGAPYPTGSTAYENDCGGTTTDVTTLSRNATAEGWLFGRRISTAREADGNRAAEDMRVISRTEECA